MSRWSDFRDEYVNPGLTALVNPIAGQAAFVEANQDNDIPVVNELNEMYQGITGQTAADAAQQAAATQAAASVYASDLEQQRYEQTRADQMPWLEAGQGALETLQEMMGEGAPSIQDYEMSDYANFMRDEGLSAIEARSLAGGYYNTGATSREMLDYSRDVAGQDYQQYLNNYYQSLNPYLALSGTGQQMSTTMGQQGMQSAAQQGNYAQQAAAAQAAGITGAANAQTQGYQNLLGLGLGIGGMFGGRSQTQSGLNQFQTPQNWGSYNSGSGFQSAWEQ